VNRRTWLTAGVLTLALLLPGAAGKAAMVLTVFAAGSLAWSIADAAGCRWYIRWLRYAPAPVVIRSEGVKVDAP